MALSLTGHIASEEGSVEQPALALFEELGWAHRSAQFGISCSNRIDRITARTS